MADIKDIIKQLGGNKDLMNQISKADVYSGSVFKTKNLSFYNESMLRVEKEPLHHCNQCYAA